MQLVEPELIRAQIPANMEALAENPYPGRGIVQGINVLGDMALQAYWVMGRSDNSRNRILVEEKGVVRTEAFDASKVEDSSLIIYNALTTPTASVHVVSNGHQTDEIDRSISDRRLPTRQAFLEAISKLVYEPDKPNFTPRISAYLDSAHYSPKDKNVLGSFSVIRRDEITGAAIQQFSSYNLLRSLGQGVGLCVHTYEGDGSPLPSFKGAPYPVELGESVEDTAENLWNHLDKDNRVALVVKGIDLNKQKPTSYQFINALK